MSLPIDFSTLAGVAAVNVFVTEAIVKGCKVTKDWAKQLISWATPLLLSIVGLLCQFGLFADYGPITDWHAWIYTIVTGLGLGLVSNGLYDIPFIQQILYWLVKLFNKKKELSPVLEEFPIAEGTYALIDCEKECECEKEAPCEDKAGPCEDPAPSDLNVYKEKNECSAIERICEDKSDELLPETKQPAPEAEQPVKKTVKRAPRKKAEKK
jgi:hypothetical protein